MMNLAQCNLSGSPTSRLEHFMYPRTRGITDENRRATGVLVAETDSFLVQRDHRINTSESRL